MVMISLSPTNRPDLPPDTPWGARLIVENAGQIWKKFTTLALALLFLINGLQSVPGFKDLFAGHPTMLFYVNTAIALSGMVLAYVNQQTDHRVAP
jgi:hypothetical protein